MKKNFLIKNLLSILFILLMWYVILPPLNVTSPAFWSFVIIVGAFILVMSLFINEIFVDKRINIINNTIQFNLSRKSKITCLIAVILIFVPFVVNIIYLPLFNSSDYANRILVDETHSFKDDVHPASFSKIPLLDKDSSEKLGDRIMGQATDWVSQFYVSNLYTQINYNDQIIRVTPIEYDGIIKYFANKKEGIKGYITVNSVDGSASLNKIEKGMKYMPSAYFFKNLQRKLRIDYPTFIFDTPSFEIDNEKNPYWIVPVVKYKGIGLLKEIKGLVILDPITGESKYYALNDVPSWVDHVYSAELVIEQLNDWGNYRNGFWNSIFGQKNVVNTTEGYNYLAIDDDIYLYTGITSVSSDESNLGFVLVNLRTKETRYYSVAGAEEYSAMASAEGLVQEKNYVSSFPLLINLNGKPTYLMSLKDNAGLVKMYAFVDVVDYQKVVVSDSSLGIEEASKKYLKEVGNSASSEAKNSSIMISSITNAVIDGTTMYFIIDSNGNYYSASIKVSKEILPFIKTNDKYTISYYENSGLNEIVSIEK